MRAVGLEQAALEPGTKHRYKRAVAKLVNYLLACGLRRTSLRNLGTRPSALGELVSDNVVMAGFIAHLASARYASSTAQGDIFALRSLSTCQDGSPLAPMSKYVARLLVGYGKLFPAGKGAAPLAQSALIDILDVLDTTVAAQTSNPAEVARAIMAKALFLLAFTACLRCGEYSGNSLRWSDVSFSKAAEKLLQELGAVQSMTPAQGEAWVRAQGNVRGWEGTAVRITLRHTKASPTVPVDVLVYPSGSMDLPCPVSALITHAYATQAQQTIKRSPVFSIDGVKGVPSAWVGATLVGLAEVVGVAPALLKRTKPHSLRKGGATAASLGGASEEEIKALGRWKSDAVRGYVHITQSRMRAAQRALIAAGQAIRRGLSVNKQ